MKTETACLSPCPGHFLFPLLFLCGQRGQDTSSDKNKRTPLLPDMHQMATGQRAPSLIPINQSDYEKIPHSHPINHPKLAGCQNRGGTNRWSGLSKTSPMYCPGQKVNKRIHLLGLQWCTEGQSVGGSPHPSICPLG